MEKHPLPSNIFPLSTNSPQRRHFYCLWRHQFQWSRATLSANLCRVKNSNHTRMSTIQSRTPEKGKEKKHVTLSWKFPWKYFSTTHLPFPSSNSIILKAFLKIFSIKMKPTKCPAKKRARREKKEGRRVTELRNLTFCIRIRRPLGGHFCFRTSRPREFPIQGELVINPPPPPLTHPMAFLWFSNLVGRNHFRQNAVAQYY